MPPHIVIIIIVEAARVLCFYACVKFVNTIFIKIVSCAPESIYQNIKPMGFGPVIILVNGAKIVVIKMMFGRIPIYTNETCTTAVGGSGPVDIVFYTLIDIYVIYFAARAQHERCTGNEYDFLHLHFFC